MDIDSAVTSLGDALVDAGFERPRPPRDVDWLAEHNATVAPLRLPEQLERFWRLVDPATLQAVVFPRFTSPEFALDSWRRMREEFPHQEPHNLLLIGYESWNCMWIELDDDDQRGGTLFDGRLDADAFFRRCNDLEDWLDRIVELIAAGSAERIDATSGSYLRVVDPRDELALAAPRDLPRHPLYRDQTAIGRDTLSWPAHWQRASGIDPRDAEPRGATHTIADVLASDPASELCATAAGQVVDLGGSSTSVRVRVSDGTGAIDISCRAVTTPFGLVCGERFEFDVIVPAGERHEPADVDAARQSTDDPSEQVTRVLLARYGGPIGALATAVRPLDRPR
jgi:hypothetical protein